MKPFEKIEINIPCKLYEVLKELNIDIEGEVVDFLNKKVRCTYSEEELKDGYLSMGKINLGLAKMCLQADEDALVTKEQYLTECE